MKVSKCTLRDRKIEQKDRWRLRKTSMSLIAFLFRYPIRKWHLPLQTVCSSICKKLRIYSDVESQEKRYQRKVSSHTSNSPFKPMTANLSETSYNTLSLVFSTSSLGSVESRLWIVRLILNTTNLMRCCNSLWWLFWEKIIKPSWDKN